jgi:hypothetical protein
MRMMDSADASKVNADARRHFPSYVILAWNGGAGLEDDSMSLILSPTVHLLISPYDFWDIRESGRGNRSALTQRCVNLPAQRLTRSRYS